MNPDFFLTGIGLVVALFAISLAVAWVILPFVVISKLASIERNTRTVAKFYEEHQVKISS